jgi:hypothetical protein
MESINTEEAATGTFRQLVDTIMEFAVPSNLKRDERMLPPLRRSVPRVQRECHREYKVRG